MLVARRVPVPVGLVRFSDRPDSYSVVLKLTYDISSSGWATLLESSPLSGDVFDTNEARLYPSDFSALKLTCDVLIVGEAVADAETGPARVTAAALTKSAPCAALLGPLPADPTDPLAQFAPTDQRLPWPPLPLEVAVDHGSVVLDAILPGPMPSAALVYDGKFAGAIALPLHVDGILLDPIEKLCHVTFRGCFQHAGSVHRNVLLVLDVTDGLTTTSIEEVEAWGRAPIEMDPDAMADVTLSVGNRPPRLSTDDELAIISVPPPSMPIPSESFSDLEEVSPDSEETRIRAAPESDAPEVDPDTYNGDEEEPEELELIGPPSMPRAERPDLAPIPTPSTTMPFFKSLPPPPAMVLAPPSEGPDSRRPLMVIGLRGTPLGYSPPPAEVALVSPPPAPEHEEETKALDHEAPGVDLETFISLRSLIWIAPDNRKRILKAHKLTELDWEAASARWAAEIATRRRDAAGLTDVVRRLREAVRVASSDPEPSSRSVSAASETAR